jgi:hypothetical protein
MMGSVIAGLVVCMTCMSSSVSADLYTFEDTIDTWGPFQVDAAWIAQGFPLNYTHDLTQEVDFDAGDLVTEAWLELDFTNDATDDHGSRLWGIIQWDFREYATVAYDGVNWVPVTPGGEVDDDAYSLVLNIDWLNNNGMLDVTVAVSNPLGTATAWLDHSKVHGTAETPVVPVPGAVLLGTLGLVAAGRKLRRFV